MSGSESESGCENGQSHRSRTSCHASCGASCGGVVHLLRTATRVCFLVARTSSVAWLGVLGLGRHTDLRVEGLYASVGLFAEGSMTTLYLGVGRLEVRDIVVSVARLGRVDFVCAAWGLG